VRSSATGTYRAALDHRSFRLALTSYGLAAIAQGTGTVALAVALFARTQSTTWVAVAAATRLVPYVVVSPIAGLVADRLGHRRTLEVASVARVVLAAGLTIGIAVEAPPAVLALLALAATVAATPVYPALNAFVPAAVRSEDLAAANSLLCTVETMGWIIGPAIGGLLVATTSPAAAAGGAAAVLAIAVVELWRIPRPAPVAERAPAGPVAPPTSPSPAVAEVDPIASPSAAPVARPRLVAELVDGLAALRHTPSAVAALLLILAANLIDGAGQVLLLVLSEDRLGLGEAGFGLLSAAMGAGALAAMLVNRRMAAGPRPIAPLLASVAVAGLTFAALGVVEVAVVAVAILALSSGASVVTEVVSVTIIQRSVPVSHLARVFGMLDALVVSAILAGTVLAPVLDGLVGLRWAFVVSGAVLPGAFALLAPIVWRARRDTEERGEELRPLVTVLAGLPLLRHAPETVLESLVLAGRPLHVPAGAVVLHQGEESDDVYAVIDGSFAIFKHGTDGLQREVARCGPGEVFGEIGPLLGVSRTATVQAATASDVLRIPGPSFVDAVHGSALGSAGSPVAGIVTRVASPFEPSVER
jgi:MFS family permease